jgi:hypothetical protein
MMVQIHASQRDNFACNLLTSIAIPSNEHLTLATSANETRVDSKVFLKPLFVR